MTVPFAGIPLADHGRLYALLHDAGFTDLWTSEVAGADAFTPLTIGAITTPRMRLGTAVAPVFTRGPGLLAMTAGALAETAPGRFVLGIGASSPVVVGDWNAVPFTEPFKRSRDMLRFLRAALAGEQVDREFDTFAVRRFRLERPPATPPSILLAALRPAMLRLAAAEADGTILNWLAATDVPKVLDALGDARPDGFEIAARIFMCPTADADHARAVGRRMITSYLTVPAYAEFHRWLGNSDLLDPVWTAWAAGDRRGALAAVPDELVDALVIHGTPHQCKEQIMRYVEAGVTTPVMAPLPTPELTSGGVEALHALIGELSAPSSVERG
ncbi:LLM class F420-dependent oxidoreductase [Asanoa sp. NPDC050611]|uniref:LLM class F420-dependent oxidoreductase n=1 Tax=Asanoa sp. NPDC050611 TaxID=3157098 RepID=UPI00340E3076